MEAGFAWAMAGASSAHRAATATHGETSPQRAGRRRRTSAEPQRARQGPTAAAAAAPAAQNNLSRLQQLADASPQVAQLRRLQALGDAYYAPVAQLAGGPEEEEPVQGQFATAEVQPQLQQAPRANNTGLPDQLKSGIESMSGLSMDHVRVHFNSSQPAQLNALAYAQGSDIHLAPGQERHLPHEAWHVVQQAQGRVRPTLQLKDGVPVNDDVGLEREADVMGSKALEGGHRVVEAHRSVSMPTETAQRIDGDATNTPELNVANNDSAPLANGLGSAQRGGNEMQRIADQRPEAALQRQVQAWGDGSERVGQLRAWQRVADGRGVGGKRQDLKPGFDPVAQRGRLRDAFGASNQLKKRLAAEPLAQLLNAQSRNMAEPPQGTVENPIVQRVSMTTLRERLSPDLMNVFRYWIRFEMKQAGVEKHAVFLNDHSYLEVLESLQVWAQPRNFEYLRKSEPELHEPTKQGKPIPQDTSKLQGTPMDGISQIKHLELAKTAVNCSKYLVRKMNAVEAEMFRDHGANIDMLRPKGLLNADAFPVERSVAFSMDLTHKFGDSSREKDETAYSNKLVIEMTEELKQFLVTWLWNTNRTGGYKNNPQFKLEHGKYNIIVPETGWLAFWTIASKANIEIQ